MQSLLVFLVAALLASQSHAGGCDDAQFDDSPCMNSEWIAIELPAVKNLQDAFDDGDLGGSIAEDAVGTTELDDGADTPLSGEYCRVDTVDQAGLEWRTSAETRGDLSLVPGTDVQAWDAELDTLAGLIETQGSILIGDATPAWSALGIGAANAVLLSDSTTAAWDATPAINCTDCTNTVAWTDIEAAALNADTGITIGDNDENTFVITHDMTLFDAVETWATYDLPQYSIPETIILTSARTQEDMDDLWRITLGSGQDAGETFDDNYLWDFEHINGKFRHEGWCPTPNDCNMSWGVYAGGADFTDLLSIETTGAGVATAQLGGVDGDNYISVSTIGALLSHGLGTITADRMINGSDITLTGGGQFGLDTTDNQLEIFNVTTHRLPLRQYHCVNLSVYDTTDDFVWVFDDAVTITYAWCRAAVNVTTEAEFELATAVGGANMSMTTDVICQELTDSITKEDIDSGGAIAAMGGLVLEVTNTPDPNPQNIVACFEFTTTEE
jgi:hypothetical protein